VVKDADIEPLKFFRFTRARIGEVEMLVSRSGYTGELGYELYAPAEQAMVLWDSILQTSREYHLLPYGAAAMQSLRIEKSLPLYGADLSEEYTPFHAGLDRWISFSRRDFIGRDALLKVQEVGIQRRWVGLILRSEIAAAVNDRVFSVGDIATSKEKMFSGAEAGEFKDTVMPSDLQVGHVTCGSRGHSVGEMLAMAYIDTAHSWPGHGLIVEINGRPVTAKVASTPFFDPSNARIRARARDDDALATMAAPVERPPAPPRTKK
jgi:aminomethyltransferase